MCTFLFTGQVTFPTDAVSSDGAKTGLQPFPVYMYNDNHTYSLLVFNVFKIMCHVFINYYIF